MDMKTQNAANTANAMLEKTLDVLEDGFDKTPLGVMVAFDEIKEFLTDVVTNLGADPNNALVQKAIDLRKKIGDSTEWLNAAKTLDMDKVKKESAAIATRVLQDIEVPPFSDVNGVVNNNLKWILPALQYDEESASAFREAYKLKLTLNGAPDEVSEMRFMVSQELLLSRLVGAVPATSLYSYWLALKPTTELGVTYHEAVARELEKLPAESWPLEIHASANVAFWQAIAETVEANSCDGVMRILSQQCTDFLKTRADSLRDHLTGSNEPWAKATVDKAYEIIRNIDVKPVFPHVELGVFDLSPMAENFEHSALVAATANC